jgi:hypothetical protein
LRPLKHKTYLSPQQYDLISTNRFEIYIERERNRTTERKKNERKKK